VDEFCDVCDSLAGVFTPSVIKWWYVGVEADDVELSLAILVGCDHVQGFPGSSQVMSILSASIGAHLKVHDHYLHPTK